MARGDIAWDTIGKLLIALAFLLLAVLIIYLFRDKMLDLLEQIKRVMRFGV